MAYIVLDLEWNQPPMGESIASETEDSPRLRGEIIQIGAVRLNETWEIDGSFEMLVRPIRYTKMNPKVRQITGIDNEALLTGKSFPEALAAFTEFCGENCRLITWGRDDIHILKDNLALHGIAPEEIAPCYNAQWIYGRQIAKSKKQVSLSDAVAFLGEPEYQAHDALNDARSTALVCRHLNMEAGIAEITSGTGKKKKHYRPRHRRGEKPSVGAEKRAQSSVAAEKRPPAGYHRPRRRKPRQTPEKKSES